jgi:hypothetical protein
VTVPGLGARRHRPQYRVNRSKSGQAVPFQSSISVIGGLQEWKEFADEGNMPQPERFEDLVFGVELVEEAENER